MVDLVESICLIKQVMMGNHPTIIYNGQKLENKEQKTKHIILNFCYIFLPRLYASIKHKGRQKLSVSEPSVPMLELCLI